MLNFAKIKTEHWQKLIKLFGKINVYNSILNKQNINPSRKLQVIQRPGYIASSLFKLELTDSGSSVFYVTLKDVPDDYVIIWIKYDAIFVACKEVNLIKNMNKLLTEIDWVANNHSYIND